MKWVSVKDRLPEEGTNVLVINTKKHPYQPLFCCYYDGEFNFGPHNHFLPSTICLSVTHWVPLPEVPNE